MIDIYAEHSAQDAARSDNPAADVLRWIPPAASLILDVGCGTGTLGAEYKRRNPLARIIGIAGSTAVVGEAKRRLDHVYVGDLDREPAPFVADLTEPRFDCLIYEDVLEQLRDPWAVVRRHLDFLADDGSVLVSVRNLEHWSFIERLLKGTWPHEDQGSFDVRRLLWFTADGIRQQLRNAGLASVETAPRAVADPAGEAFVDALAPGLSGLGVDPATYLRRAASERHLWRARRHPAQDRLTIVSTMLSPIGGVSNVRVVEPMEAMAGDPDLVTMVIGNSDVPPSDATGPRIMILHRPLLAGDPGLATVGALLARDWVVVCEFDDHPDYIPVLQRPDIQNFRAVHAVQTSTEPLASVLRQQNPEVGVFRNAIAKLPDVRNFAADGQVTLMFAGLNREDEWPPYLDALNAVAARFGSRIHFEIVNDRAMFEALRTAHKNFTPLCGYATYQDILSRCEISFMPLSETPFNRCKSDLKFIEAGAHRAVALASKVVYQDTIKAGTTGLLFATPAELELSLSRLVAQPDVARAIGDAARRYVQAERMLAYQLSTRVEWYRSLWARREALTRSLHARVPELAQ